MAARPPLYMVDSDKGITNLHVPSDVIIDASMPAAIRAGGKGWGPDGAKADMKCCIPDNCYAGVYDETINFFKANGALDVTTAGAVSNVGLMAQKAEEYGSHPTTFELPEAGTVRIVLDERRGAARARGREGRHLALGHREKGADPRLDPARHRPSQGHRHLRLLARRNPRPRRRADRRT